MCDTCGQRFAHVSYLKSHQRSHSQDRRYSCQECTKKFAHAVSLRHHVAMAHADTGQHERFSCHQCGRSFPTMSQVRVHVRTHVTEESTESLQCGSCGEVSNSASALAQHLLTVHGSLGGSNVSDSGHQYACNVCGRLFSQPGNLRRHVLAHLAQRPSQCTVCGKKFTQPSNLKAHLRTHSAERPSFSCVACAMTFADKSTLRKHAQHHCYMTMSADSSTATAAVEPHNMSAEALDTVGTIFTETVGCTVDDIAFCGFV